MKKVVVFFMVFAMLLVLGKTVFADVNEGLVGYYPFNDNANDESGYNNHGIGHGNVSYIEGIVGKAIDFDGVDDYIQIPHGDSLVFSDGITISVWLKSSYQNQNYIFHKFGNDKSQRVFNLTGNQGTPKYTVAVAVWGESEVLNDYAQAPNYNEDVWNDEWHHILATYDRSSIRLYINGELSAEEFYEKPINYSEADIGIASDPSGGRFPMKLDELKIYNRALLESEVQELYKEGINLNRGLVAYYPFDGNANDESGNGNDGIEQGGPTYVDGVNGQAASFDGIDDYINSTVSPSDIGDTFTIAAWFLPETFIGQRSIVSSGSINNVNIDIRQPGDPGISDTLGSYVSGDEDVFNGGTGNQNNSSTQLVENEWAHGALIVENNGNIKLYLNGNLEVNESKNWFGRLSTGTADLFIGAKNREYYSDVVQFWDGVLDEVRIYNRALSEEEVQELFNGTQIDNTVTSSNCTISNLTIPDVPPGAPEGFNVQAIVGFTAELDDKTDTLGDISITFASLPVDPIIYKVVNGTWVEIYPANETTGITNVTLNGTTLSYTIEDGSDCDVDGLVNGIIQDPVAAGSSSAVSGSSGCFINTVASDLFGVKH